MDVTAYIDGLLARAERSPLFGDAAFPGLYPLYNDLQVLRAKLEQPLHAAVIGEVKAGKSTLINAFAGGDERDGNDGMHHEDFLFAGRKSRTALL